MSTYEWVTHVGHHWQVRHGDLEPDHVSLAVTVDYGRLDEPTNQVGVLALLAGALTTELQRPVEVGPGDVSVPTAKVVVRSAMTTITLEGRRKAVLGAWDRLGELFEDPHLPEDAVPAPIPAGEWNRDLATYVGLNAETLSDLWVAGLRDVRLAEELLRSWAPSACQVRRVFSTNDPYLVGSGWAGAQAYGEGPVRPARYLDRRPALVACSSDAVIVSATAPVTPDGLAACHALCLSVLEVLNVQEANRGVGASLTYLRDVIVLTVGVSEGSVSGFVRRGVADQLTQPGYVPSDDLIARAVTSVDEDDLSLLSRLRRLWGKDGSPTDWTDALLSPAPVALSSTEPPTASGTRRAFGEVLSSLHVPLKDETESLATTRGFILWSRPDLVSPTSMFLDGCTPEGPLEWCKPHAVYFDNRTLMTSWYRWARDTKGAWKVQEPARMQWIDTDGLSLAMRDDNDFVTLIDDRARSVTLAWQEIVSHPSLKEALEAKGLPRIPWYRVGG